MFEAAEIGNSISKEEFLQKAESVRAALLEAQRRLAGSGVAVVVIVGGAEGGGKEETVDLLLEWMDARGIETHAMWDQTDEERDRPTMWRFWRVLPATGRMGILFGSWYTSPIIDRVFDRVPEAEFQRQLHRIVEFERMLANENVVVVKFWMHLSKDAQRKRLKDLKKDKRTRWRVSRSTWKFFKRYDDFRAVSEEALRRTNTDFSPWHVIEATDDRYRELTVASTLLSAINEAVVEHEAKKKLRPARREPFPVPAPVNVLRSLDTTLALPKEEYSHLLADLQGQLGKLIRRMHEDGKSLVLAFEGPDAAGKGGAIRRVTRSVDSRLYRVTSVAAPTDEERSHPYLWRFWRSIPRRGYVTVYDRSWYGRVLVERIEGFCAPDDWKRAYREINEFEEQLVEGDLIVLKFWLALSSEEQLQRFKHRSTTPYKQYKLTEEDWRNRKKWDAYEAAACDMIERTNTPYAPWVVVEANDKYWARIKVLRAIVERLKSRR